MHIKQQRKCVACRESKHQNEMLRIAKVNDQFIIDLNYKLDGRGAYICKNSQCINLAIRKKALNRAFKQSVDDEIYQEIGKYEQNN